METFKLETKEHENRVLWLNSLVILCIEKDMIKHINVNTIICNFAYKKARRNYFV